MNNFFNYIAISARHELFIYVHIYICKLRDINDVAVISIVCICTLSYINVNNNNKRGRKC